MSAPVSEFLFTLALLIEFFLIFFNVTALFLIFAVFTEFFNCLPPTLFFGRLAAAKALPPIATKRAR